MQFRVCATLAAMEFTYRISEADYLAAVKFHRHSLGRRRLKVFLAWAAVLAFLILVWFTVLLSVSSTMYRNSQVYT
ncbi:MAG: hypothetical protein ACRD3S_21630, partial [Terracidiphilus sp.]